MALPNDSSAAPDGAVIATHLIGGKEYQVVLVAGPSGHLHDSLPTYYFWRPYVAGAQNQIILALFNGAGSGKIVKLRKLFVHHNQAAVTGVGTIFDLDSINSVPTGGTLVVPTSIDSLNPAVPAEVIARRSSTGGAAKVATLFSLSSDPEETRPGASIAPMINWMPEGPTFQDLVLREDEGFRVIQITNTTAGVWGCLAVVTIE